MIQRLFIRRRLVRASLLLFVAGIWLLLAAGVRLAGSATPDVSAADTSSTDLVYMPLALGNYVNPASNLCRFGVGAGQNIGSFEVNSLRLGWYVDWTASNSPARPGGIDYVPTIRLSQTGSNSYSYAPSGNALDAAIADNPGAIWAIGNEPDRRDWQDSLEPHVYARAYHDLYGLIREKDPTARIAAGSIVQPTPLRLQYLDIVLDSYKSTYGQTMPVDVWNIHNFILREEEGSWGAEIPPGIDAREGMLYEIDDNDDIEIFKQHIQWFREWMADNGYQNRPLIITEFGVQMWPDLGFPPERVNAFMDASFDYLRMAAGPTGYPADDHRLVQQWAWYSLTDDQFNGWLFDRDTKARTVFGDNFAAYTGALDARPNPAPLSLSAGTVTGSSEGYTVTLRTSITNNGNAGLYTPLSVHFYEGTPNQGGTLIQSTTVSAPFQGCAAIRTVEVEWEGVPAGSHHVYVAVDPSNSILESDETDNTLGTTIDVQ